MKAITYVKYGSTDVLKLKQLAKPTPQAGEILIRVQAAEVTKADVEMRSFRFPVKWFWLPLRVALGIRKPRRQVLGGYFSGEVMGLGDGVTQFSMGEEVFGATQLRLGAYGEFLVVPASYTVVPKPHNMNFSQAAAVPLGGLNALHFMRLANIQVGDQVLINGAGGSIGLHAVQIAKSLGAEVTAIDSAIKENILRQMGADHFIDFTKERFYESDNTYDVVFNMVAGSSFTHCINTLKPRGRYLSGNPSLSVMLRSILTSMFTDKSARFALAAESIDELRHLKKMIEESDIKSIVDRVYPMEQVADAHTRVETEERLGAVVLAIGELSLDEPI